MWSLRSFTTFWSAVAWPVCKAYSALNREIAEEIALVAMQSSFVLDSHLNLLKEKLAHDEFQEYCKKYGKVMAEAYAQVLAPIYKQFPELLPEKMGGSYKTNDDHYKNIYQLISSQAGVKSS